VRRENRINLIFLLAFLAVSLPGAVILFRKKLQPGAPRMDEPDRMSNLRPYMAPLPGPVGVRWVVPDRTRQWLSDVAALHGSAGSLPSSAPPGPQWEPVISDDHLVQVAKLSVKDARIGLVIWNSQVQSDASRYSISVHDAADRGRQFQCSILQVEPIPVPSEVRRELVQLGFIRPPAQVMWVEGQIRPPPAEGSTIRFTLAYRGAPSVLRTEMDLVIR